MPISSQNSASERLHNRVTRFGAALLAASIATLAAQTATAASIIEVDLPVHNGAQEPSLFNLPDGRILVSWTEPTSKGHAVRMMSRNSDGWSNPETIVNSESLFVNWADFPSIAAFDDGTLAVHWLAENSQSAYGYDVNITLSRDEGRTWGDIIVPHDDRSEQQHGFVALHPIPDNRLLAVWLDGRAYDIQSAEDSFTNSVQLRATTIGSDGTLAEDTSVDIRTCSCCQTSAAVTESGIALVAYRDRTAQEVRDISVVRLIDDRWSEPVRVHNDGWKISGCPVNGPAIDAVGENAVVAWFSSADNDPAVKVAFSNNAGESFGPAIRVDKGEAAGRVDVVYDVNGSAFASWVEWTNDGEVLFLCRVSPERGCETPQVITVNKASGSLNFPRIAQGRDGIFIAWTQPLDDPKSEPDRNVTIRMVRVTP